MHLGSLWEQASANHSQPTAACLVLPIPQRNPQACAGLRCVQTCYNTVCVFWHVCLRYADFTSVVILRTALCMSQAPKCCGGRKLLEQNSVWAAGLESFRDLLRALKTAYIPATHTCKSKEDPVYFTILPSQALVIVSTLRGFVHVNVCPPKIGSSYEQRQRGAHTVQHWLPSFCGSP